MGSKKKRAPGAGNGRSAAAEARHFEETIYFHEARLSGHTYAQIANLASTKFGYFIGPEKVRLRIRDYRSEAVAELVDDLRALESDRLDRYLVTLDEVILKPKEITDRVTGEVVGYERSDQLAGIDRALRISERRSKLLGLDGPSRAEVTLSGDGDAASAALRSMISGERTQ